MPRPNRPLGERQYNASTDVMPDPCETLHAAVVDLYPSLRRLAASYRCGNHFDQGTMTPTAFVHEGLIKVLRSRRRVTDGHHLAGLLCCAVRSAVLDYARQKNAEKRTPPRLMPQPRSQAMESLVLVDDLLRELEAVDARSAEVVRLRFYGGMAPSEISRYLGLSVSTVERDWDWARSWLQQRMSRSLDRNR